MFTISEQIEDIKTAMISMIGNSQNRDVARGAIKYRRLVDFISNLNFQDVTILFNSTCNFEELLEIAEIAEIAEIPSPRESFGRYALIKKDGTFYEMRFSREVLSRLAIEWQSFIELAAEVRKIIFEAITDMGRNGMMILRYRDEKYSEYFKKFDNAVPPSPITIEWLLTSGNNEEKES